MSCLSYIYYSVLNKSPLNLVIYKALNNGFCLSGLSDGADIIIDSVSPTPTYGGPIMFNVEATPEHWFQLDQTCLIGELQIVKDGEADLVQADVPKVANYLPATLWKQVEVFCNFTNIQDVATSNSHVKVGLLGLVLKFKLILNLFVVALHGKRIKFLNGS